MDLGRGEGVERGWIICFCCAPIEAGQVLLTVESFGDRYVLFHGQNRDPQRLPCACG